METPCKADQGLCSDPRRQSYFERRVVCPVCLSPRLEMVTGICQHRVCSSCVYTANGDRRPGLSRCPTCQMENSLPIKRPIIPEDTIEMQKTLGIIECPNENCEENMWAWEAEDHLENCQQNACPDDKNTSQLDQKAGRKSFETTSSTDPRPSRIRRCPVREVRELLDEATGFQPTSQRRSRQKKRLCSMPQLFTMRYPLRNVNR